jgi:DNA-binding transcriptional LysR family regulator
MRTSRISRQLAFVTSIFTNVNLSALDLNLLLVLDAVLTEQSVVGAARRLHVTPPAISNALTRLRAALGDPIVTRSGRGIVPTPRAQRLGPAIRKALGEIDAALHGDTFDPTTNDTQITLAIADAGQLARLPKLSKLLATKLPRARLRVIHVDTMIALGGIAGTEVDVAIGVSDTAPGIHRKKIYDERSVVIVRRAHPRIGGRITKSELSSERHVEVHVALGRASRPVAHAYARLEIERDIAMVVPAFAAAVAVVGATDLVATIPESVVHVLGPSLGVRIVSSPLKIAPLPMHMSWHERTNTDAAMMLFRELVVSTMSVIRT